MSNPLDVMTYAAYRTVLKKGKSSEWASKNVLGMAGVLDTARYRFAIANALGCAPSEVQSFGHRAHNSTMVPLVRYTRVSGIPLSELLPFEKRRSIEEYVKNIGFKMIEQRNHSAYYARRLPP